MIVSTFVLDSIRKLSDIDTMLKEVGLPPLTLSSADMYVACMLGVLLFINHRDKRFPPATVLWIRQQCYLLGCVPRFVS